MPWQCEPADQEALRSANVALSGRKHREVTRLASIELRSSDPRTSPWEAAAIVERRIPFRARRRRLLVPLSRAAGPGEWGDGKRLRCRGTVTSCPFLGGLFELDLPSHRLFVARVRRHNHRAHGAGRGHRPGSPRQGGAISDDFTWPSFWKTRVTFPGSGEGLSP